MLGLSLFIQTESRGDIRGGYRVGHQNTCYFTDTGADPRAERHGNVRKIAEHLQNHHDEDEYDNEYIEPGNHLSITKQIKSVLFTCQVYCQFYPRLSICFDIISLNVCSRM